MFTNQQGQELATATMDVPRVGELVFLPSGEKFNVLQVAYRVVANSSVQVKVELGQVAAQLH
jgi:hypothetical protein